MWGARLARQQDRGPKRGFWLQAKGKKDIRPQAKKGLESETGGVSGQYRPKTPPPKHQKKVAGTSEGRSEAFVARCREAPARDAHRCYVHTHIICIIRISGL